MFEYQEIDNELWAMQQQCNRKKREDYKTVDLK